MEHSSPQLIKTLRLHGFLSFGPEPVEVPLTSLNVLIGPNGSGKSNLVEALAVLRATPGDLPLPIRKGGGVKDWLFKGATNAEEASLEVSFAAEKVAFAEVLYRLVFGAEGDSFVVVDERLENTVAAPGEPKAYFYFGYENGRPMLNVKGDRRELRREDIDPTRGRSLARAWQPQDLRSRYLHGGHRPLHHLPL
jgi:predicted ATPase